MSSCQVESKSPSENSYLTSKSRANLEMLCWGAVCMPNCRDRILDMPERMFSPAFASMLVKFRSTLSESKTEPEILEWFIGNHVNIMSSNNVIDSIQSCLERDAERRALKDLTGELIAAASIGDRDNLVDAMKRCLEALGEM